MIIEKNQHLMFTSGDYSGYSVIAFALVLKDLTQEKLQEIMNDVQQKNNKISHNAVVRELKELGFIKTLETKEIAFSTYQTEHHKFTIDDRDALGVYDEYA